MPLAPLPSGSSGAIGSLALQNSESAMLASSMLSEAIAELHGIPGKKDRRRELRTGLIDIQAGISEEMSSFLHTRWICQDR